MAERRMFTRKVTDDDNFMSLSSSAQALYLHLSMSADDDGFSNQVSVSMFKAHASLQDLEALLQKRFIYQFDNGVIVIKHWRMANALRKDRYKPTAFQEELAKLDIKENGSYTWLPNGCQMVAERLPQDRLGKDRIEYNNKTDSKESVCRTQSDKSKVKSQDIQQVIDTWNALSVDVGLQTILRMSASSQRYKMTAKRIAEYGTANVVSTIESIRHSRFLQGDNNRNWIITFDWFIKPNNYPKVADGNYLDREYRNRASKSETVEEAIDLWGDDE